MKREVTISVYRFAESTNSTTGLVTVSAGQGVDWAGYALERPDNGNQANGRIPSGEYDAFIRNGSTSSHGYDIVELMGVPDRTLIQFHIGSVPTDSIGCFLVGSQFGVDRVSTSSATFNGFMDAVVGADPSQRRSIRVRVLDQYIPGGN